MKLKAAITEGLPKPIANVFKSAGFAKRFFSDILGACLGVVDPGERPAEFYVQKPDFTINVGSLGIELRLTGVSRDGRKVAQFHKAIKALHGIAKEAILGGLKHVHNGNIKIQLFCVIILDSEIETSSGSGAYSNIIESKPEWVVYEKP